MLTPSTYECYWPTLRVCQCFTMYHETHQCVTCFDFIVTHPVLYSSHILSFTCHTHPVLYSSHTSWPLFVTHILSFIRHTHPALYLSHTFCPRAHAHCVTLSVVCCSQQEAHTLQHGTSTRYRNTQRASPNNFFFIYLSLWNFIVAGWDQSAADQQNTLAEGYPLL